eukprot:jgi/Psemu1/37513/gm1.37513_g
MNTPELASLFPSFDQALATFLHDSFDIPKESNSPLCEALINSRYRTCVVSSSVMKPLYGASFCPVGKPSAYTVRKPLYETHSMTYVLPAVCITKRHHDAIKLKLYHLHATLLFANWIYNDVT